MIGSRIFLGLALASTAIFAAVGPKTIPRTAAKVFVTQGLFEGGKDTKASLEDLRLADHSQEGYERWVFDFSNAAGQQTGAVAPRFQLQYQEAEKLQLPNGKTFFKKPAKFLFFFRSIAKNHLTLAKVKALAARSQFVSNIHLYPPIEQGDMALEFVLKDDVRFEPHQPIEREGRLVLDLKVREEGK